VNSLLTHLLVLLLLLLFIQVVPYSDHSSYQELCRFVELVKPRSVRPLVQNFTGERGAIRACRTNMRVFDGLLDRVEPVGLNKIARNCDLFIITNATPLQTRIEV